MSLVSEQWHREMMGMTPNTLVAGFKCNYVHEWDYIVLYVSMYPIRIRREWKKNRHMKLIINTNPYIFLFVSLL